MFQLPFMVQAFAAAIITGLLLSYLGVHVVGRGIVFVDLALGQISLNGCCFCCIYGNWFNFHSTDIYSGWRTAHVLHKYSRQAFKTGSDHWNIICICLGVNRVAHFKNSPWRFRIYRRYCSEAYFLSIWNQIITTGIIFGTLILGHFIFQKKFFELTESYESGTANIKGFNIWNFFFYISIGLSIVFAVKISGVIPVFSYLIIPSVCAIMLARPNQLVLFIAMLVSFAGSFSVSMSHFISIFRLDLQ